MIEILAWVWLVTIGSVVVYGLVRYAPREAMEGAAAGFLFAIVVIITWAALSVVLT